MEIKRRKVLVSVGIMSAGTVGCVGASDVKDIKIFNQTSKEVSATVVARVKNGEYQKLSWELVLTADEMWTWNKLGDRTLRELVVRTADGLRANSSWGPDGVSGQGVAANIREDEIKIFESTG